LGGGFIIISEDWYFCTDIAWFGVEKVGNWLRDKETAREERLAICMVCQEGFESPLSPCGIIKFVVINF
jgi:hypothetical protein